MEDLKLYEEDRKCIQEGQWLNDNVIRATQQLLKQAHPHIGSLQPTVLGEMLAFQVQNGEFVQVLHTNGCHWITISTIGLKAGHVNIYDSQLSYDVPMRTKEQIAAILHSQDLEICLHFEDVQVQRGSSDCGLFALAFATSLCHGEDPGQLNYVQHELREHLLVCLQNRTITPFPRRIRKRKKIKARSQVVLQLHCYCRLPESGKMIQCDRCHIWFHTTCINSTPKTFKKNIEWFCSRCK